MTFRYTLAANQPPSEGVYSAVAEREECSPLDLRPLGEVTDPQALDALLRNGDERSRIFFQCCEYEVEVTPTEIKVRDLADE